MNLPLPDGRVLSLDRPIIMGILNATPDSFSDGGTHDSVEAAVRHGLEMVGEGADIIDVGGESTRPGSRPVPEEEQRRRVVGVIQRLREEAGKAGKTLVITIDPTLPAVAAAALDAGAAIINDISAGRDGDRGMLGLAAARRCPIVLMHMQGTPETMQQNPTYKDVVAEVEAFLRERAGAAERAGVERDRIILDPGIGFGKTKEHNLALLANLPWFVAMSYPVMLGTSRKRFMGSICSPLAGRAAEVVQPHELVGATCATTALGVAAGVLIFRVHDVRANRQAADVAWAIRARERD